MPNIASVLKDEIARIARKESRRSLDVVRKAVIRQRRYIAALRKHIAKLDHQIAELSKIQKRSDGKAQSTAPVRFVARGVRSMRERLGLSASDLGHLVGVSAQSVYNWERKVAKPRAEQLKLLADLRGLGKREVTARLNAMSGKT